MIPRYRDLWRFRAPLSAGEIRRTERWLATARVALTIAALLTLWMEPVRGFVYSRWFYWLLIVYLVHAVVVMLLVRFRPQSTVAFRLVVHSADIVWPVLISMFATAQRGPFFLFFVFVMAAAAYRWGLWETLGTAGAAVALLWAEAFAVRIGLEHQWLRVLHLPRLGVRELDPQQLFMSSVYLIVLGLLLGYMSENQKIYLFDSPADAVYASHRGNGFQAVLLDRDGARLRDASTGFLDALARLEKFDAVVSVALLFGSEWSGRVYLFDPQMMGEPEEELRFLQEFAQQVGPAIYNVYLVRRLRERAGALERSRFARELHDGAIQSLIAVEMQLDVLRRQSGTQAPVVNTELGRIQKLLREEVLKLRELMQAMKSFEVDADRLLGFISDTVERFRRETGIAAEFVSELERVDLAHKGCRELARIVQESLVNVRKHSGAHHVLVRLAQRAGHLQLTVEDDGKGFSFSGRLSGGRLEAEGKGQAVIRERVRLLAGELAIESTPGHGARQEVRIPPARKANHG